MKRFLDISSLESGSVSRAKSVGRDRPRNAVQFSCCSVSVEPCFDWLTKFGQGSTESHPTVEKDVATGVRNRRCGLNSYEKSTAKNRTKILGQKQLKTSKIKYEDQILPIHQRMPRRSGAGRDL